MNKTTSPFFIPPINPFNLKLTLIIHAPQVPHFARYCPEVYNDAQRIASGSAPLNYSGSGSGGGGYGNDPMMMGLSGVGAGGLPGMYSTMILLNAMMECVGCCFVHFGHIYPRQAPQIPYLLHIYPLADIFSHMSSYANPRSHVPSHTSSHTLSHTHLHSLSHPSFHTGTGATSGARIMPVALDPTMSPTLSPMNGTYHPQPN